MCIRDRVSTYAARPVGTEVSWGCRAPPPPPPPPRRRFFFGAADAAAGAEAEAAEPLRRRPRPPREVAISARVQRKVRSSGVKISPIRRESHPPPASRTDGPSGATAAFT